MSLGHRASITWLGHSAFEIVLPGGETVLVDPWLADNPACPDARREPSRADAILVTHGHADHFGGVPELAKRLGSKVVANHEIALYLTRQAGLDEDAVAGMNLGGRVRPLPGLEAEMVRADHSSSIDTGAGPLLPGGAAAGFVLRGPELPTLYVAGDTSAFAEMMVIGEVHEPEVAILPIGGRYTMDPGAAAWATKMLGVRRVVPCHYGTFPALAGTPEELVEALAGLGGEIEVVSVEPGQTLP